MFLFLQTKPPVAQDRSIDAIDQGKPWTWKVALVEVLGIDRLTALHSITHCYHFYCHCYCYVVVRAQQSSAVAVAISVAAAYYYTIAARVYPALVPRLAWPGARNTRWFLLQCSKGFGNTSQLLSLDGHACNPEAVETLPNCRAGGKS